jgi:hypothetical protein
VVVDRRNARSYPKSYNNPVQQLSAAAVTLVVLSLQKKVAARLSKFSS